MIICGNDSSLKGFNVRGCQHLSLNMFFYISFILSDKVVKFILQLSMYYCKEGDGVDKNPFLPLEEVRLLPLPPPPSPDPASRGSIRAGARGKLFGIGE